MENQLDVIMEKHMSYKQIKKKLKRARAKLENG